MGSFDEFYILELALAKFKTKLNFNSTMLDVVKDECVADWKRNAQSEISRKTIIKSKSVFLIDSSSRKGLVFISPVKITGITYRPYVMPKGDKTDKSYYLNMLRVIKESYNIKDDIELNKQTKEAVNVEFVDGMVKGTVLLPMIAVYTTSKNTLIGRPQKFLNAEEYKVYSEFVAYLLDRDYKNTPCSISLTDQEISQLTSTKNKK